MKAKKTKLVGILNVTPDSFSDGGKFNSLDLAISHLRKMILEGAEVIDIGAESTRPQAVQISDEEEWGRLETILPKILGEIKEINFSQKKSVQSSIDSYHFSTIKKSYELGVDVINDVSGLIDERIVEFVAKNNITTILMHNEAIKTNPNLLINKHIDIDGEIISWAKNKINQLEKSGVKKSQLIFDPGIGFNKNADQSIRILKNIDLYRSIGLPIYIGHSKKSFLERVNFSDFSQDGNDLSRAEKTVIISKYLTAKSIDFLRVHDVALNRFS